MSQPRLCIPFVKELPNKFRVVLASGSSRRKELLDRLDLEYEIIPSNFAEDLNKSQFATPRDYVLENATIKTREVYRSLKDMSNSKEQQKPLFIIGSDTVVVDTAGHILEKPADADDAYKTLKGLSNQNNTILTAVCILVDADPARSPLIERAVESTEVTFCDMDDTLIKAYVDSGDPMDKAGSYGYQSLACFFVKDIRGDFYNAMGFPCARFYQMLLDLHSRGHL